MKRWVDGVLPGGPPGPRWLLPAAAALVAAMAALLFLSRTLLAALSQRMLQRLRDAAAESLLFARLPALRRHAAGDLLSRVFLDASLLTGFGENLLRRVVGDGLVAAGAVAMMFVLAPRLALAAFLLAPVIGLLLARLGDAIRRRALRAQAGAGELSATLAEQLRGATAIRGLEAERGEAARFAAEDDAYASSVLRVERVTSLLVSAVFAAAAAGFLFAVDAGGRALSASRLSPGALLAFCLYAGQTIEPLRRLAEIHGMLQRALGAADRLFEVLDLPREPAGTPSKGRLSGTLVLEGVRFRHDPAVPLLEGIDLTLRAGERLALTGATGSGKSTLARLLVRLEEPAGGRILLGGTDLASAGTADVRRAIHVVEPEPFVFRGSLLSNVRLGAPGASRADAAAALERAGLGGFAASLPGGLEGRIGETGRLLSSGERQRIALARALLRDPAVLVLDEATAALDVETEDALFAALERWLESRALLLISHRSASLRRCARRVHLSGGRLREVPGARPAPITDPGPGREAGTPVIS